MKAAQEFLWISSSPSKERAVALRRPPPSFRSRCRRPGRIFSRRLPLRVPGWMSVLGFAGGGRAGFGSASGPGCEVSRSIGARLLCCRHVAQHRGCCRDGGRAPALQAIRLQSWSPKDLLDASGGRKRSLAKVVLPRGPWSRWVGCSSKCLCTLRITKFAGCEVRRLLLNEEVRYGVCSTR